MANHNIGILASISWNSLAGRDDATEEDLDHSSCNRKKVRTHNILDKFFTTKIYNKKVTMH